MCAPGYLGVASVLLLTLLVPQPLAAGHSGSAPIHPEEPDDEHFLVDVSFGLDTGCTFRSGGPLVFDIEVDRFVGDVDGNGFLLDAQTLISNKVVSPKARLIMPAFDVDSGAAPPAPFAPEIDKVFLNGEELSKILTGVNNTWIMNEFEVDIRDVKFPARGAPGQKPAGARNEVRIQIDTGNIGLGQLWCTAIDWAQLQFKAMAPILLVHGITGTPGTWEPAVRDFLTTEKIPFEHRIQLAPNGSVANNGRQLAGVVRDQARSFGVEKVHLVVHSKGGLDSRRFLSAHYQPDEVKVLSLHTLSTPHHGSVHADLSIANRTLNDATSEDPDLEEYLDSDGVVNFLGRGPQRPGLDDLQTTATAAFNAANPFPGAIKLYTHGADADLDNNGAISVFEAAPLIPDNFFVDAAEVGSMLYRILRDVSRITVTRKTNFFGINEWHEVSPVATATPQENDLSVTDTSSRHPSQSQHFGPVNRNHSRIKDANSMRTVLGRIRADFPVQ